MMALYIFNFSVDSRDAEPDSVQEDLTFNDIESFYEFLLEGALGIENAVAEHDEHDQDDGGAFEFKKNYLNIPQSSIVFKAYLIQELCCAANSDSFIIAAFSEIDSPPPKG